MRKKNFWPLIIVLLYAVSFSPADEKQSKVKLDSYTFGAIEARSIGPAVMGGRIMAIDVAKNNPNIIFVGAASGGVWKSTDGGTTFKPVFDDHIQSIGSIAIDPKNAEIVWVGTGEGCPRNSVSVGTGIFKSTDGGNSWECMGLEDSERIPHILIDPKNTNIVYVAALGHLWDSNEERGLYKTTDSGKTWERILYVDENTGCADVVMDPQDSSILYAAMWEFRRWPYFFKSGGPGSGLYKTTDAGKTWKKLEKGLPEGNLGRIALSVAPSRPNRIYASVEAKKNAIYRSDDMGASWTKLDSTNTVNYRPFYFSHIYTDPVDYNCVYKLAYRLNISTNGGKSFVQAAIQIHPDLHALWINPKNPSHLLIGTDGGVYVSYDKGNHCQFLDVLPVSQFYRVNVDMERPYNVYGGLQDNGSWFGPSSSPDGIENKDWLNVGGGDGFCVYPDLTNNDIIYSEWQRGNISRMHLSTGEVKDIKPMHKEGEPELRFNWNTPVCINSSDPKTIYMGSQFLFHSRDKGDTWERISDDLTTDDPEKLKQNESGGLTVDNSGAENHCTIFTISESSLDSNIVWAGTDDGNVQVTRDGGKTWTNVVGNVPDLPPCTWVSCVEASHFDKGTAHVTFDGHRTGDKKTYVYKTTDFGKTWTSLAKESIEGWAHVIREDHKNPNLLFLGTEFGLFVSVDGGEQWARFTGKIPRVSIRDMVIHPRDADLILGTHGRGILIIDDITPLRKLTSEIISSEAAVLESRPSVMSIPFGYAYSPGDGYFRGSNPQRGAAITYYLKKRHIFGDMKLEIYNSEGKLIKTLPGGKRRGINRVSWEMRMKPPEVPRLQSVVGLSPVFGPMVPEGIYTVKLIKGKKLYSGQIRLIADPKSPHSAEDRDLQNKIVWKLYHLQEEFSFVVYNISEARDQARDRAEKLKKKDKTLDAFSDKLDKLYNSEIGLRSKIVNLYSAVSRYGGRPSQTQLDQIPPLEKRIERAKSSFASIVEEYLDKINKSLAKKKLDPIKILTKEEWLKKQEERE